MVETQFTKTILSINPQEFAKRLNFGVACIPDKDMVVTTETTNRPGLLLTGYDGYFPYARVQLLGNAEHSYLQSLTETERLSRYENLFSRNLPCVIYTQGVIPNEEMVKIAKQHEIPLFYTDLTTSQAEVDVSNYLSQELALSVTIHGELLDISGIGVLLVGESGIGKSETALELVHRGQMLVADDLVVAKRIKNKIYGYPHNKIQNFLELRGVGLIDVEAMYGVGSVLCQKKIQLVIEMQRWQQGKAYDRLGDEKLTYDILGKQLPKLIIPVSAGRNLAVVIEAATRNYRLKEMGRDALTLLKNRMNNPNI